MATSIPKTMKAAQLMKYKQRYEIHDVPIPEIGANDLLIRIGAAGFCHTDYQVWEGVYSSPCPIIPSHEPAGAVVSVGSKAGKKFKVGQRVGVNLFKHQCHACLGCKVSNDVRFCEKKEMAGLANDGGMAEYIVGDADTTVLLPDEVPFEQAAPLMCAGATVWAGIEAANVAPGEAMGVIGIGGLGTLAVQFCKALGYPVVAVDNRSEGRALAQEFSQKADLVIDYEDKDAAEKIKKWTKKGGLAGVIVCTDNIPAIKWSTKTLRPHGVCVPLGLPVEGFVIDAFDVVFNELSVKGSLVATPPQVEDMLKTVAKFGVCSHITTVPLEKVPDLPDMYMDPHLKGRLVMTL